MGLFKKFLLEAAESDDVTTKEDLIELINSLELDEYDLEDIADYILDGVFFEDELEFDDDEFDDDYELGDDEFWVDEDEDGEMDEAFIKKTKGDRTTANRASKIRRRRASVKRDAKKRSKAGAKCSDNQRVMKAGPGIFKCVTKNADDKKRSIRMKKWKKMYKQG